MSLITALSKTSPSAEGTSAEWEPVNTAIIRRRVRPPMPEPEAPAVVRHAGRLLARGAHDASRSVRWVVLAGDPVSGAGDPVSGVEYRLSWGRVLALDPTAAPALVDLGDGAR
jgi:hypothetical protein